MPRSLISAEELQKLLVSILTPGQAEYAVALLQSCHDAFKCVGSSFRERFFEKGLTYRGFEVHVRYFQVVDDSVKLATIQFKRKSRFPAPFVNRNAALVREIRRVIDAHYGPGTSNYVKDEQGGGQFHYVPVECRLASDFWEDWGSQCAIYDEPYSSGQTSPEETRTRNDFVVVRFNRDAQEDWSPRRGYPALTG